MKRLIKQLSFTIPQMEPLFVMSAQVKREMSRDTTLSKVYDFTMNGWPQSSNDQSSAYPSQKEQLPICKGCLMLDACVILPPTLCAQLLDSLYDGYLVDKLR